MAVAEHEITQQLTLTLSRDLHKKLEQAALASGQTVSGFVVSSLVHAAEAVLEPHSTPPPFGSDPRDRIVGIFKDEPLMEALMERVREDRRVEIERISQEVEAQG